MDKPRRVSSFFWPVVLIGAGIILLLRNLGVIPEFSVSLLLRLWPLILVVIGLDIIFGHRARWLGGLIGLLAIGGVITFLILSPSLNIKPAAGVQTDTISEPLESATSARYYIETSSEPVHIEASTDATKLIEGTIVHRGTMNFNVTGAAEKVVRLSTTTTSEDWLQWNLDFSDLKWNVGLSSAVPSEVILDGGSGSVNVDLTDIMLSSLQAAMGSGSSTFVLPVSDTSYKTDIQSGSGSVTVRLPEKTSLELTLDSGSGSVSISMPAGSALRVEVMDSGSGSMNIPPRMEQIGGTSSSETGAWQTVGFDAAQYKIVIKVLNRGSGSISIH